MYAIRACLVARFQNLRRCESGSATIEAVLWLPMFFFILVMVVNASFIFHGQAQALRIIQDKNRAFATGSLINKDDTEKAIKLALSAMTTKPVVATTVSGNIITSEATIPLGDLAAVGAFSLFTKGNLTIRSQHFKEY
jgi:Flp pilus assembly protein TadG